MPDNNTQWRYHYAQADDVTGIDFDKYGRNGFELCGLTSHNGKLLAVFKRNPTPQDKAGRSARKARAKARTSNGETATPGTRGTRGR